jgi:hypothetical protein
MKQCMNPVGNPVTNKGVEVQSLCALPLDHEGWCRQCVETITGRCLSHGCSMPGCTGCQPARRTASTEEGWR